MGDDLATQQASADEVLAIATVQIEPVTAVAGAALAYSDQTDGASVGVEYVDGRARWLPVAALVTVILAVTGGAAGVILWLGNRTQTPVPGPVAEAPPASTPGPLNGLYRFEWHDAQAINRMADGSLQAVPPDWGVETIWYAIRSTCNEGICTATRVRVDDSTHGHADLENGQYTTMTLVNGQWHLTPRTESIPCNGQPGEDLWETADTLTQLPDGSLTGQQVLKVATNGCGIGGMVRTTPVSATRVGDVPPTVEWNE
jgi:serine/threonine-protein kinase